MIFRTKSNLSELLKGTIEKIKGNSYFIQYTSVPSDVFILYRKYFLNFFASKKIEIQETV